jgi:hypothetical protein
MDGEETQGLLIGNRLVLIGAVLYLLEWVAIFAANVSIPLGADATGSQLASGYVGHEDALGWAAGWFSVVLLGRILIVTGLRAALADSGRRQPLMDFATAAMAVGVALEVATYGIVAGASWAGSHGASIGELRMLDSVAFTVSGMVWGPTGIAILCCAVAMWRSQLFPRVLVIMGMAAGCLLTLLGAVFLAPRYVDVASALMIAPALVWIWMLWTGVLLWRRSEKRIPVAV